MPGERVDIIYDLIVRGQQKLEEAIRLNERMKDEIEKSKAETEKAREALKRYENGLDNAGKAQEKNENAIKKASSAVRAFRREIFIISLAVGTAVAGLKILASQSDQLRAKLEKISDSFRNITHNIGNAIAALIDYSQTSSAGVGGPTGKVAPVGTPRPAQAAKAREFSRPFQISILQVEAEIARLQGNELLALQKRQKAELLAVQEKAIGDDFKILEGYYLKKQKLEEEDFQRTKLNIKKMSEIRDDFNRGLVEAFRGGTSETIFKFLQGEQQSIGDILKTFQAGINKVVSEAISQSLFTSLYEGGGLKGFFSSMRNFFTGRSKQVIAQEETNKILDDKLKTINDSVNNLCQCISSAVGSRGGTFTMDITPAKVGALGKIGSIAGLFGAVASFGKMLSGGGGKSTPPITQGPGDVLTGTDIEKMGLAFKGPVGMRGGWVSPYSMIPRFQGGGEVPVLAHRGEFIVNRRSATANKEILQEINQGDLKQARGGGNVYFIKANDAQSFASMLSSPSSRSQIEIAVMRAIGLNSDLRRTIKEFT